MLADPGGGRASLRLGGDLALLAAAGWLIVRGANRLALAMGLSAFILGATTTWGWGPSWGAMSSP